MDGILILNTTTVSDSASWVTPVGLLCGVIAIIAFYFMSTLMNDKASLTCVIISVCSFIVAIGIALLSKSHWRVNEREQYECVIDNDVSIVEVYKNYNVIERRGDIWILEEKTDG